LSRRSFLKQSALVAGILSAAPFNILNAAHAGEKVRMAQIGCGKRGMLYVKEVAGNEELVAIVDADETRLDAAQTMITSHGRDTSKLHVFTDYRKMFDKLGKHIDAVFIATPNHHHALPSLIAIDHGINVYCEDPLCHTIAEARQMRAAAAKSKVATQMGNQDHCSEGYLRLREYIMAGAIGKITEVHGWTCGVNGGEGPRRPKQPVPAGLHWDEWIGPAPYRDFHDDLHPYEWHGWHDFGNGSIGNAGSHILEGAFAALKIEHPTSIEVEQMRGGSDERWPLGGRVRWDVPARGDMPPLKVHWYEGLNPDTTDKPDSTWHAAKGNGRYFPQLLLDLRKQYPTDELDNADDGALFVGEKGVIFTITKGRHMHIVPWEKMNETPQPPNTLPRTKDVIVDFLDAVRAGKKETAGSFDYGSRLTEFMLLSNLAMRAGAGKKIFWDGLDMKVTNLPNLNQWVKRTPRKGWRA
jgi:hypothetical protein